MPSPPSVAMSVSDFAVAGIPMSTTGGLGLAHLQSLKLLPGIDIHAEVGEPSSTASARAPKPTTALKRIAIESARRAGCPRDQT